MKLENKFVIMSGPAFVRPASKVAWHESPFAKEVITATGTSEHDVAVRFLVSNCGKRSARVSVGDQFTVIRPDNMAHDNAVRGTRTYVSVRRQVHARDAAKTGMVSDHEAAKYQEHAL